MNSSITTVSERLLPILWHKNHTWRACGLETVRSIEDRQEGLVVHVSRCRGDDVCNLGLRWVLAECAKKIAQGLSWDGTRAFLVEEGERFLVFYVRRCLSIVRGRCERNNT